MPEAKTEPGLNESLHGDEDHDLLGQVDSAVITTQFPTLETGTAAGAVPTIRKLRIKGRCEWLLFLTGINLMLLSFIMVLHATVAVRHMEIAGADDRLEKTCQQHG